MFLALKEKLFGRKSSKSLAKSRLHFVLVQDRTGLDSKDLADFKEELVSVIEKYFVIDKAGFDISYQRDRDTTTLFINSPIIVRRQDSTEKDVGARHKSKQRQAQQQEKDKEREKEREKEKERVKTLNEVPEAANASE